ncbi:Gfo/Idh/MocA family oxidoreductase [Amycolatopsis panacis]|uniref:Gfo/Idh/MocA family oxidoreductase n=1 Tax=Amycolatopsis panacis TaxID=2340917 RepID=UPI0018F77693|nr:Gfo/Idh/MocA family oxidoreductase [Amycolatopsis panacis]
MWTRESRTVEQGSRRRAGELLDQPALPAARLTENGHHARPSHVVQHLGQQSELTAVYVPLPAAPHVEWDERALRAGPHVLAEKPLAITAKDAAVLVALAATRGWC